MLGDFLPFETGDLDCPEILFGDFTNLPDFLGVFYYDFFFWCCIFWGLIYLKAYVVFIGCKVI